jgi:hypothetical protein
MKYLLLSCAVVMLSGCTVSLQPFYTADAIVDDQSLAGRWSDGESDWLLTRVGPGKYEITSCDGGTECKADAADTVAVTFRSGGVLFLDFQEKAQGLGGSAIRPHGLFQMRVGTDVIDLVPLEADRIQKLSDAKRLDVEYAELEGGTLLTAKPHTLQEFVARHLTDPQVFGEPHRVRRM